MNSNLCVSNSKDYTLPLLYGTSLKTQIVHYSHWSHSQIKNFYKKDIIQLLEPHYNGCFHFTRSISNPEFLKWRTVHNNANVHYTNNSPEMLEKSWWVRGKLSYLHWTKICKIETSFHKYALSYNHTLVPSISGIKYVQVKYLTAESMFQAKSKTLL